MQPRPSSFARVLLRSRECSRHIAGAESEADDQRSVYTAKWSRYSLLSHPACGSRAFSIRQLSGTCSEAAFFWRRVGPPGPGGEGDVGDVRAWAPGSHLSPPGGPAAGKLKQQNKTKRACFSIAKNRPRFVLRRQKRRFCRSLQLWLPSLPRPITDKRPRLRPHHLQPPT